MTLRFQKSQLDSVSISFFKFVHRCLLLYLLRYLFLLLLFFFFFERLFSWVIYFGGSFHCLNFDKFRK